MASPVLVNPIPEQVTNERAAYGPFDLKKYIEAPRGSPIKFSAEIADGRALPTGMICTEDGILTGIPAKDTQGNYEITITATNDEGSLQTTVIMIIKPIFQKGGSSEYYDELKSQIWEALENNLPLPELSELYDRPITILDVYWILQQWSTLTIWDAFNLDPAGEKTLLHLEGASEHFNVYDRGSCLVGAPKDLFSHERTIEDALKTARAMAREVYKRNWTIEMAGFEKMVRATWVELQHLGDKHGKQLEILNFDPTLKELLIYREEVKGVSRRKMEPL